MASAIWRRKLAVVGEHLVWVWDVVFHGIRRVCLFVFRLLLSVCVGGFVV
jgi:hypothetical protein